MAASSYILSTLRDVVEANLMDSTNVSWSTADLDAAIRLALDEMSKVNGSALALKDLDSAAATTVDALDDKALIEGACVFAALGRELDRSEKPSIGEGPTTPMGEYAKVMRSIFNGRLRAMKLRLLARSTAVPSSEWAWAEDDENTFE